jgi:drug/metabolite transporter (DMT)-like permease
MFVVRLVVRLVVGDQDVLINMILPQRDVLATGFIMLGNVVIVLFGSKESTSMLRGSCAILAAGHH